MTWQPMIDELERLKRFALQMGGPERVERHHNSGKLTVRERIELLSDPDTFEEIGSIAGNAVYEGNKVKAFTHFPIVMGTCCINGRMAIIDGSDFTIRGGVSEIASYRMLNYAPKMAIEWKVPYIRLIDAVGGSVSTFEEIGATYLPFGPGIYPHPEMLQVVPVVSAVLGSVAGWPAVEACLAHFSVMVKKISHLFVAGPPVVKAAFSEEISKEELGNYETHVSESGVVHNLAENEEEAFEMIKRFLSYMPDNVWKVPPYKDTGDDPVRKEEALLSIIPENSKKPYDPYNIIEAVLDKNTIFELSPFFGRSIITALSRVSGFPVGVMINNPNFLGGAMDVSAAKKVTNFVNLCNIFHLPIVYFADQPGFMVGKKSEKQGMLRYAARVHSTIDNCRAPWIVFVIRQLYGVAGGLHLRESGMNRRYAWPSGNWGSMHIEGGTSAAFKRIIESADNPEAKRLEIEQSLKALASPLKTANFFGIEEIIDPRNTRPLLCKFIEAAQKVLENQLGITYGPGYVP